MEFKKCVLKYFILLFYAYFMFIKMLNTIMLFNLYMYKNILLTIISRTKKKLIFH